MKIQLKNSQLSRLMRWGVYVMSAVLIIALISWLTVPRYLKNSLEQQVATETGRQFTVADVTFNPFTLTVDLYGIVLFSADKKTHDFSADELILRMSPTSLFRLAPIVREMVLKYPLLKLVRRQRDGKEENNFSDVINRLAANPSQGEPVKFYLSNIQLIDGAIHLDDQVVGKEIHIESINLGLPFLSNFARAANRFIEPKLSAKVDGSLFELTGRSKPFLGTRETSVAIDFNHLDLVPLLVFTPKLFPFKVNSAKLSSQLSLNFVMEKNVANMTLSGGASLNDIDLSDLAGAPLFKTKAIHIGLQEANLTTDKFKFNSIVIDEPQLWAGLNSQGQLNWIDAHTEKKAISQKTDATAIKPVFELAHFKLKNGIVHWSDAANATPAMQLQLNKFSIDAQQISTNDKAAPGKLTLSVGQEHQLHASFVGSINPAHSAVTGQITLSDLALADYQPYINRVLAANVSGKLSLKTQMAVLDGNVRLSDLSGALVDLKMQANNGGTSGSNVITANKITIENASMNSELKQAKVEKIALNRVQGDVFRDTDGAVNLIRFLKKDTNRVRADNGKASATKSTAPTWHADIDQIALTDSNFVFGDKSKKPAVNIRADGVEAKLEQVSSKLDHPFKITMSANLNAVGKSYGKIAVDGTAAQKSAQLNVDLKNFSVVVLQPYFTDLLNITLEKGAASIKGKLAWNAPAELNYQGMLTLENFSSSDKATSDSFLRWKKLFIEGVDVGFGAKQQKINLGKINISDFYARAILSEQGKLNLENILVHQQPDSNVKSPVKKAIAVAQNNKSNASTSVINVGQINLNNGVINYTDNFIKPHFSMRMTGMTGKVGAIQSTLAKPAPINLIGKIDNDAPIVISGSLNPLFSPMLLDIKMTATGIDLPRLTAYSAKYAGYAIERGKLSLDVEYHVKDKQLTAKNTLKIDQLTFGKKVDSPNATKLPVLLLVDLLTDRNGRINLDVPISGTLDDPQFTVGGVIMKVLLNALTKVITSPFSLLAHSFSGASELSYVEFASGTSKLTDATKAKLDNVAKALAERPNLKLTIIGRADLTADTPGMRERKLVRQIKKISAANENETNETSISENEKKSAIWKIYSNGKFDKPRNMVGLAKVLPTEEMEKMILENTPISEDDLNALATRRASVVRTYLTEVVHVPSERIYLNAPKINETNKTEDKGSMSRVDFDLRM
jgi:hypothetical protein